MPGALTHILVGLAAGLVVYLIHFKLEYSLAIFVGHLLPDALKFGLTAVKQMTWDVFYVEQDSFFHVLAELTSNYANWFMLGFFVLGLAALLYHFHVIKKKKMEEYDELAVFVLTGVILHLILDGLIQETNPWF